MSQPQTPPECAISDATVLQTAPQSRSKYAEELDMLSSDEIYWRENYEWFLAHGYQLRSRYHPDWIASWKTPVNDEKKDSYWYPPEDFRGLMYGPLNDATRLLDGKHVVLKQMMQQPEEAPILKYFSLPEIASSPRNHTVPIFEMLHPPHGKEDCDVAVMPILRAVDDPDFETIGEAVDFIRQILEGFQFLHEHRVAHRDIKIANLMMDSTPLGIERFHFPCPEMTHDAQDLVAAKFTRTQARPKYYIIDFGWSKQWSPEEVPVLTVPLPLNTDPTLPELDDLETLCDPFACDVYYIGNMLRTYFITEHPNAWLDHRYGCHGFRFLSPLIRAMTRTRPRFRITMEQAVARFEKIVAGLSERKLRSRLERKSKTYARSDIMRKLWKKYKVWQKQKEGFVQGGLPPIPSGPI